MMKRGDKVKTWFDTGAVGATLMFGTVIKAGSRSFTVEWESGICNRLPQGYRGVDRVVADEWYPGSKPEGSKNMPKRTLYLGDAVFAHLDDGTENVVLTTSNGLKDTNTIVLEDSVLLGLLNYVARTKPELVELSKRHTV